MQGILFIVSAPAGTGKTTLVNMLLKEFDHVERSISYTTRKPRKTEENDIDYHFVSHQEFEKKKPDLLEYAEVFGEYYGTSRSFVEKKLNAGKHIVLVIDTQGALIVKEKMDCVLVFIAPPSIDELAHRLESRDTESAGERMTRLSWAEKEIEHAKDYDYLIVNKDLLTAYDALRATVLAEEHRVRR